jgi:hypothetical protein
VPIKPVRSLKAAKGRLAYYDAPLPHGRSRVFADRLHGRALQVEFRRKVGALYNQQDQ